MIRIRHTVFSGRISTVFTVYASKFCWTHRCKGSITVKFNKFWFPRPDLYQDEFMTKNSLRIQSTLLSTSVADPNFFRIRIFLHTGSRIRIKEFRYFNPKKWFLSSWKNDLGCSSRIRILFFYPSRIPGVYILVENGYLFPPPLGNLYFFPKKTAWFSRNIADDKIA